MMRERRDVTRLRGSDVHLEAKCRVPSHRKQLKQRLLILLALLSSSLWILFQVDLNMNYEVDKFRFEHDNSGFIINTRGCRIQNLDLFDKSIEEYVHKAVEPNCHGAEGWSLVRSTVDSLFVVESVAKLYLEDEQNFTCCYSNFRRENYPMSEEYPANVDRLIRFGHECFPFYEPVKIAYELVKVICQDSSDDVFYEDYFAFSQTASSFNSSRDERLNVLILGVDALSRLNFHRQLPSALAFLEERGSIELLGYNKVGDNTFPNLIPLLAGLSEAELQKSCWASSDSVFDECEFLWNRYKENGYVTGFGEDCVAIGLFQYQKAGFRGKPTDFYTHPYHLLAENKIGEDKWLNCHICVGNRFSFRLVLDDALSFAVNQKNTSNFGFFWINSISHDFLNLPRFANNPLTAFYEQLESHGILNTTLVVLMSDHGIRWGGIRSTYQGYVEERLPGMFLLFPRWFQDKYGYAYANLRQNRKRLTTPFDIHETLLDLIDLNSISDETISQRLQNRTGTARGVSLFLPIPENRTCQDAGISTHWCTCRVAESVPLHQPIVKDLSSNLVDYINGLVSSHKQCARLDLHKIKQVRLESVPLYKNEQLDSMPASDYVVTVQTRPGHGIFEATLSVFPGTNQIVVRPPVSRINTYGNQSLCMTDFHLKLYCFCANFFGT